MWEEKRTGPTLSIVSNFKGTWNLACLVIFLLLPRVAKQAEEERQCVGLFCHSNMLVIQKVGEQDNAITLLNHKHLVQFLSKNKAISYLVFCRVHFFMFVFLRGEWGARGGVPWGVQFYLFCTTSLVTLCMLTARFK